MPIFVGIAEGLKGQRTKGTPSSTYKTIVIIQIPNTEICHFTHNPSTWSGFMRSQPKNAAKF